MFANCLGPILVTLTGGGMLLISPSVDKFRLTSSTFGEENAIPIIHAYMGVQGGQNISPALNWAGSPGGTRSFALACIDRHPIAADWVHWLVIDIPDFVNSLAEGASHTKKMPVGSKELRNSFGSVGWGGPQPPKGTGVHRYEFLLYALNVEKLTLPAGANLAVFNKAIEGKVIAIARLTGTFER
jgi:Raf kinase inhibitor-like YbhB/YbcL family protein